MASVWRDVSAAARRDAQNPKDYADLHVFKSIEAILPAADRVDRETHCQYGTYCKCTPVRPV